MAGCVETNKRQLRFDHGRSLFNQRAPENGDGQILFDNNTVSIPTSTTCGYRSYLILRIGLHGRRPSIVCTSRNKLVRIPFSALDIILNVMGRKWISRQGPSPQIGNQEVIDLLLNASMEFSDREIFLFFFFLNFECQNYLTDKRTKVLDSVVFDFLRRKEFEYV